MNGYRVRDLIGLDVMVPLSALCADTLADSEKALLNFYEACAEVCPFDVSTRPSTEYIDRLARPAVL